MANYYNFATSNTVPTIDWNNYINAINARIFNDIIYDNSLKFSFNDNSWDILPPELEECFKIPILKGKE